MWIEAINGAIFRIRPLPPPGLGSQLKCGANDLKLYGPFYAWTEDSGNFPVNAVLCVPKQFGFGG